MSVIRSHISAGSSTRGLGLLEAFLASRRAQMADKLLPAHLRRGAILDIGCGSEPYFLARTEFSRKIGVDRTVTPNGRTAQTDAGRIRLLQFDAHLADRLPFPDASINAVTMLAVFEHIRPSRLVVLINEIGRVLRPGGVYVFTTPAGWTAPVLTAMKVMRLVSSVEINEHQDAYSQRAIRSLISRTRMADMPIRLGSFEMGMNNWAIITKESREAAQGSAGAAS